MKIIVGLGNPGRKYEDTRHNAGFMAVDALAGSLRFSLSQEKYQALIGRGRIGDRDVLLMKPQTFMNESGRSVQAALRFTTAGPSDLIVAHDELDLPLGIIRIKIGGGHGGHNGLRSIMEQIGSADFVRVRVGIGRPSPGREAADYVLSSFMHGERSVAADAVRAAAEALAAIVIDGPVKAMNDFNRK
jgi:PTH1 family peptidyl-tRNA hydrolase